MANNGTITGSWNGSNAQYLKLRCYWEVTSQSTANKTSTITLHWIAQKTTSNLYTNKTGAAWSRNVGGTASSGTVNFNIGNTAANTDYEFLTQTGIVVPHNPDGTANPALSGTIDLSGTSAGVGSFSGSMSLPTIATTPPTASLSISDTWSHPSGIESTTYVGGYTKFKLTATASATSPATVSTYAFYNGSSLLQSGSASTFTYTSANSAGSYSFKVVVTDSYGNSTTSSTVSATVNAYSTPTITATTFRCNSGGTADGSGTYASLKMTWTVANITGNTASVHKVTFNGSDTTLTSGTAVVKSGVSTSSSYVATYTVTDTIGNTATVSQTVQSEMVHLDFYPSTSGGVAFGKVADTAGVVDFGIPIKSGNWTHGYSAAQQYQYTNGTHSATTANVYEETSIKLTTPVAGLYALSAWVSWNNYAPRGIGIVTRSSSSSYIDWSAITDWSIAGGSVSAQYLRTGTVVYLPANTEVSVWLKLSGTGQSDNAGLYVVLL